ncbi:hypothetical protein RY27_10740, partial [Litorilinea aerophila]
VYKVLFPPIWPISPLDGIVFLLYHAYEYIFMHNFLCRFQGLNLEIRLAGPSLECGTLLSV